MKVILDTNIYVGACRSEDAKERFRAAFFPLLPVTFLAAVVAYELGVSAADRPTQRLVQEFIGPLERSGRCVVPTLADWMEAAAIITTIGERDRAWRSKLPALLNDILIALCARRVGATLVTYNGKDFRLIRRHREFALRVLAPDGS